MSEALTYLRHVVEGRPDHPGFEWDHVLAALAETEASRTPDAERLLVGLARFNGPLPLAGTSANLPHAMSPVDVLRAHAIQTLADWDLEAYRGVIEEVARTAGSFNLKELAESYLEPPGTEG